MSEQMTQKAEATVRDALDHARTAAQEFHQAIKSGVLAKRPDAKKAEIEGAIRKARRPPSRSGQLCAHNTGRRRSRSNSG